MIWQYVIAHTKNSKFVHAFDLLRMRVSCEKVQGFGTETLFLFDHEDVQNPLICQGCIATIVMKDYKVFV